MKEPKGWIRAFSIALILYGAFNLLGYSKYDSFKMLCNGLPEMLIFAAYVYGVGYGIMSILCGTKIMRLEDWARKTAVVLVFISLVLGLLLTPTVLKNLSSYFDMISGVGPFEDFKRLYVVFSIIFTLFEISLIYFFTRPKIKKYFK